MALLANSGRAMPVDLPKRIPGHSLRHLVSGGAFDDSLTIYRGVARVGQIGDPLSPGTPIEITAMPVEYFAALNYLERVHSALVAWAEAA